VIVTKSKVSEIFISGLLSLSIIYYFHITGVLYAGEVRVWRTKVWARMYSRGECRWRCFVKNIR